MPNKFNYVKKGYDPQAVDSYIDIADAELKGYKEKSEIINQAIVSAQQAADDIIKNAKNQGRVMRRNIAKQLEDISVSLEGQKQWMEDFKQEYNLMISKYLHAFNNNDFKAIDNKINALEKYLRSFSDEVNDDIKIESQIEEKTENKAKDKKK